MYSFSDNDLGSPSPMPHDDASFDLTPDEFRRLGQRVIEMMLETLEAERNGPVIRRISGDNLRALLNEPLPEQGGDINDLMTVWREQVMPFCRRNGHPRFFGYVCTSADPLGMLADALASAANQPVTAWRSAPSATEVERLVVRWLDELTGFGGNGGLLVSGGSSANFHGLACALTHAETTAGVPPGARHRFMAYMSREGHVSMRKALHLLGLPPGNVQLIDIDEKRRMRLDELRHRIHHDRSDGFIPAVVCASAGTANNGVIDPLEEIAEVCAEHGIWYHIDGSYGAPAVITNDYRWMARAFASAHSLSLDPHKWLFAPADAGCILVRDEEISRRTFSLPSEYTHVTQTDPVERYAFFDHGLEMSRRFRGLKVWTILKARGVSGIRRAIQHDIDLRRHLDARIAAEPRLESLGSELSIACFRYRPDRETSEDLLNTLNKTILETLVEEGRCYMSPTELDGVYALRVCIVNFRTRRGDIDFLVEEILRVGNGLSESKQRG